MVRAEIAKNKLLQRDTGYGDTGDVYSEVSNEEDGDEGDSKVDGGDSDTVDIDRKW